MTDFELRETHDVGDPSASHAMWITVLKAKAVDPRYRRWAWEAVTFVLDKIVHHSRVPGARGRLVDTDNPLDCSNILESAERWRTNHEYFDEDGCYLWLTNCREGDLTGEAVTWNAFADQTDAWVTTQLGGEYRFKAGVLHEALHGFILSDGQCDDVRPLTGPNNHEHSLGHISDQGAAGDLTSPMVIGYTNEGVHTDGRCDRDADSGGPTKVITWCTVNAVEYSREHSLHH